MKNLTIDETITYTISTHDWSLFDSLQQLVAVDQGRMSEEYLDLVRVMLGTIVHWAKDHPDYYEDSQLEIGDLMRAALDFVATFEAKGFHPNASYDLARRADSTKT